MYVMSEWISFFYGVLTKIVDDINDMEILKDYKLSFELLLLGLTLYVLFMNKSLSPLASGIFFLGGLIALVFAPAAAEAEIWKLIIFISFFPFLYHLSNVHNLVQNTESKDIYNFLYISIPLFICATLFSLIEDRLVPEDNSYRKLIDKICQVVIVSLFLTFLPTMVEKVNLDAYQENILRWSAFGWLGYCLMNVITLVVYFLMYPEKKLI